MNVMDFVRELSSPKAEIAFAEQRLGLESVTCLPSFFKVLSCSDA